MIFQWGLSSYRSHDILIWVMIIFAAVMAFFLLMEYFNTRKSYHLLWGLSLIVTFIAFHQVANTGSYTWLTESVGTGMMILIPGLIATGLLLSTFESKQIIGQIFLLCIAIMTIGTTIIGLPNIASALNIETWFRITLTAITSLISLGIMLGIPLYTTIISKETSIKAFFTIAAAALLIIWVVALLLGMTIFDTLVQFLYVVFGLFPYFFILSMAFFVLGMLYETKWKFTIPGVNVESDTRQEKLTFQKSKPLISSALGMAGGVILVLGSILAAWIYASAEIIMGVTVGILMIVGVLAIMIGFAILIGWDMEFRGTAIANFIRMGLGLLALIFAIILVVLPSTPPAEFVAPAAGAIFATLSYVFIFIGAVLILAGGALSQFLFKE